MKVVLSLILIISHTLSSAQSWKQIPGTKIQFSNFIHPDNDNWSQITFEYFKKGNSLLLLHKNFAKDFYKMFEANPSSFDLIFRNARLKTSKSDNVSTIADSTGKLIQFETAVILDERKIIVGYNEVIWQMTNWAWKNGSTHPCYLNITFRKPASTAHPLRFLSAKNQYCEI
jgi:hypothetical protein